MQSELDEALLTKKKKTLFQYFIFFKWILCETSTIYELIDNYEKKDGIVKEVRLQKLLSIFSQEALI